MWPCAARAANHAIAGVDAVAPDQHLGDGGGRRRTQRQVPAAGPDGGQDVVDGGRAEQPHGVRRRLLDRLEQRVAGLVGEPVGVLDDHDLPAAAGRGAGPRGTTRPRASSTPIESLRVLTTSTSAWVPDEHGVARVALAAAALRALQRGREGPRRGGPAGPGRAGEQPGVRHAGAGLAAAAGLGSPAARRRTATVGSWPTRSTQTAGRLPRSPFVAPVVDPRELEGAVVRLVVVDPDAEQLVGQGQRAGRRVVDGRRPDGSGRRRPARTW